MFTHLWGFHTFNAPATVPRLAGLGLQLAPACVHRHFPNESEDSCSC